MPQTTVRFEDLAVSDDVLSVSRVVTSDDVKRYADASGDQNPLHQDEHFARGVGFPGIIAHGMFTMGHLATSLTDRLGDPSRLKRLAVQFRAPVFMGETIVAEARVKALDPRTRTAVLDVWVRVERAGTTEYPIRKSEAVVGFAEP
jgi:acyl dehydratase